MHAIERMAAFPTAPALAASLICLLSWPRLV